VLKKTSPVFLEGKMGCGCKDYEGRLKNYYLSYEEAYDNKIWAEKQFGKKLKIYQCKKGYYHLTSGL
jgi:hypothetical protein